MAKYNLEDLKKGPKKNLLKNELKNDQKEKVTQETKTQKTSRKKIGRRKKAKEELLSKKVTVNFTEEEEKKLKDLSQKYMGLPLPKLIRSLLKENKII